MKQRKPPKSAAVHLEPAVEVEKTITHHAFELIATVLGAIENAATRQVRVPRGEEAGSRSKQASEKRARAQSA